MAITTNLINIGQDKAYGLWKKLMLLILSMCGLITMMWLLNIAGVQGLNLLLFFIGALATIAVTTSPKALFYFLSGGTVIAELRDEDLSQGSVKGLVALYRTAIWALFGFCILSGALATWSFALAPMAFWVLAAAIVTIVATMLAYKMKGSWLPMIVIIYSFLVLIAALSATLTGKPVSVQDWMRSWTTGQQNAPAFDPNTPVTCNSYHSYCIGRMPDFQLAAEEESPAVINYSGTCLVHTGVDDNSGEILYQANGVWTERQPPFPLAIKFRPTDDTTITVARHRC